MCELMMIIVCAVCYKVDDMNQSNEDGLTLLRNGVIIVCAVCYKVDDMNQSNEDRLTLLHNGVIIVCVCVTRLMI